MEVVYIHPRTGMRLCGQTWLGGPPGAAGLPAPIGLECVASLKNQLKKYCEKNNVGFTRE